MHDESIRVLALLTTAFFAGITGFIIYFVVLYRNRQLKNKQEQEQLQAEFRQELLKAQIEMQEQTLNYISGEIHDNITQVLSFVKLNLKVADYGNEVVKKKIEESRELISQAINDLRNLSKSLSFEHITKLGLVKTLEIEVERINNSGLIQTNLLIQGEYYTLGEQRDLVLFRIFQEVLNNTLKHSGAKHLKINLQYHPELFNLTVQDDGLGFSADSAAKYSGLGLNNIRTIGAAAVIESSPGKGCCVIITLNPFKRLYDDRNHSDSFG